MRARFGAVALALGVAALLLLWRMARPEPPLNAPAPSPTKAQTAGEVTPAATGRVSAPAPSGSGSPRELDAEALLRNLEPLAVTDKPRALQLALDADSKLSRSGVMAEARRALIVTLLVDVNRMSEARARARAFTAEYPDSRYLPLVQGVTGVHPRPSPAELRDARAPQP
ncbi:MAG TPA: hypothetical protein VEQ59_08925 [Polyangiaceae bacterium]|nr:hypothetical protein [Polyangiaceae bacterium]